MGLCSSKDVSTRASGNGMAPAGQELLQRIQAPEKSEECLIGAHIRARYAYISQRGYYPDSPTKANQDAFTIVRDFHKEGGWLFGVFDGHGGRGDEASNYVKDELPGCLIKELNKIQGKLSVEDYEEACLKGHVLCNNLLHASPVEDSLSGTTSISVLFHGTDYMTISNVGDSRAIAGVRTSSGKIRAVPLSHDQTPYRKDERIRVKKTGARILSLDQIEGLEPIHENWGDVNLGEELDEGGDPPRIWSPREEAPGTAFTRSLGDSYAETLGVFAEPELLSRRITKDDVMLVIASDGVFEFLTNQSVLDMCLKFQDPLEACRAVVAESYELWLQYELRTDDITMIAIYIDDASAPTANDKSATNLNDIYVEGVKPVRRTLSRQKKNAMMKARSAREDDPFDIQDYISPKTEHEKARISEAIKASFLFQHITPSARELLFSVMEKVRVKEGDWVIRQGDEGDRFYIVDNGKFEVRIQDEEKVKNGTNVDGGRLVHTYNSGSSHPSFGELALMYSTPRAASIIAASPGQLWALHRNVFRKVLMKRSGRKELMHTLRKIDILKCLNVQQIQQVADCMTEVTFVKGETIIKQGEVGDSFYVMKTGNCQKVAKKMMGNNKLTLHENDYFGESALLISESRTFSVIAESDEVKCSTVDRATFESTVGKLNAIIAEDKRRRDERSSALSGAGPPLSALKKLGAVAVDEFSSTVVCRIEGDTSGQVNHTLRVLYKKAVVETKHQESVMKEMDLLKTLSKLKDFSNCESLPSLQSTYTDSNCLYALYEEPTCCSIACVNEEMDGKWDESCIKHISMCAILGLAALHTNGVVYRGISPETLLLTKDGNVLLSNFQYARQNPEGNVTICGAPEYLAPEVVQQQGHGLPCDYWQLGVVLFELLQKKTPFFAPNELDVYAKICRHRAGTLANNIEAGTPLAGKGVPKCLAFLEKAIHPNPALRITGAQAKKDPWFSGEWKKLGNSKIRKICEQQLQQRLATDDESQGDGKGEKFSGDAGWCDGW
ncbi:hypothetical protein TrLO_g3867 [Triparma laevis f. longispina]|uniref:cGMP-dependent protein kinase n=2 Tax=Triparma laevis TaxID=1534972 RepID=A0A9W7EAV5_9STRA|nr:hypothetical protein TrLO_g3867 [Triparma laevis f. longispina]